MLLYDFRCPKCKHKFEAFRPIDSDGGARCPRCKKTAKRVFSPPAIVFKGSGFYCTDNKKGNSNG